MQKLGSTASIEWLDHLIELNWPCRHDADVGNPPVSVRNSLHGDDESGPSLYNAVGNSNNGNSYSRTVSSADPANK